MNSLPSRCRPRCWSRLAAAPLGLALLVGACTGGPAPDRHAASSPGPVADSEAGRLCRAQLGALGARFDPVADLENAGGCVSRNAVSLRALAGDSSSIPVANLARVSCPLAQDLAGWVRFGVGRAAEQILGSRLSAIETFGAYACRNVAGSGRLSAHARAEAVDISGFLLADGRRITVASGWNGSEAERRFLRIVHASACKRFGTVLGPDYNAAHHDHLHFETGDGSFCR